MWGCCFAYSTRIMGQCICRCRRRDEGCTGDVGSANYPVDIEMPEENIEKTLVDAGVNGTTLAILKYEEIFDRKSLKSASIDLLRAIGLKGGQILAVKSAYPSTNSQAQDEDNKVWQLWSFMSATNDQYMSMPDDTDGTNDTSYTVKANGIANGQNLPLLKITFKKTGGVNADGDDLFYMQFQKNNDMYQVHASANEVNAVQQGSNNNPTKWVGKVMLPTNEPYWAFLSDQGSTTKPLYLSSDGNGNMKLKEANTTNSAFLPPEYNPNIDPALLFRKVEPPV